MSGKKRPSTEMAVSSHISGDTSVTESNTDRGQENENLDLMLEIIMNIREDPDFAKSIYADCPRLQYLLDRHPDLRPIFEDPDFVRINFEQVYRDQGGVIPGEEREVNALVALLGKIVNHPLFKVLRILLKIKKVVTFIYGGGLARLRHCFTTICCDPHDLFDHDAPHPDGSNLDNDVDSDNAANRAALNAAADHMEDPEVQEHIQELMENDPEGLQDAINNDPELRALRDSNPLCAELMSNPDTMRIMVDPDNLRALADCPDLIEQDFADPNWVGPADLELGGAVDPTDVAAGGDPTAGLPSDYDFMTDTGAEVDVDGVDTGPGVDAFLDADADGDAGDNLDAFLDADAGGDPGDNVDTFLDADAGGDPGDHVDTFLDADADGSVDLDAGDVNGTDVDNTNGVGDNLGDSTDYFSMDNTNGAGGTSGNSGGSIFDNFQLGDDNGGSQGIHTGPSRSRSRNNDREGDGGDRGGGGFLSRIGAGLTDMLAAELVGTTYSEIMGSDDFAGLDNLADSGANAADSAADAAASGASNLDKAADAATAVVMNDDLADRIESGMERMEEANDNLEDMARGQDDRGAKQAEATSKSKSFSDALSDDIEAQIEEEPQEEKKKSKLKAIGSFVSAVSAAAKEQVASAIFGDDIGEMLVEEIEKKDEDDAKKEKSDIEAASDSRSRFGDSSSRLGDSTSRFGDSSSRFGDSTSDFDNTKDTGSKRGLFGARK